MLQPRDCLLVATHALDPGRELDVLINLLAMGYGEACLCQQFEPFTEPEAAAMTRIA